MLAPLPREEEARLRDLESYELLDTESDESFDRIVRLASAAAEAPVALISLVDRERQWFKARLGMETQETPREQAFCAHAILNDEVMVVEDAAADPRFAKNPLVTADGGIRFYAGAPMTTPSGYRVGTLCVIDHIPRKMDRRTRALLKDMAALAVTEMELRKKAGVDGLTGFYTRGMIDELSQRELRRARRMGQPLIAALIDGDKFKFINDTFGHAAGDAVLRALAGACRSAVRASDLLGRYGGEEFLLLMPNASLAQAEPILNRLRTDIAALKIPELKGRRFTVSIGAAELEPRDLNMAAVLVRADMALYRAKDAGRDRVEMDIAA